MAEILHRIEIEETPSALYQALTEEKGLSNWWTKANTTPAVGESAMFMFGPNGEHVIEMKIVELVPDEKVVWKCQSGPWAETGEFVFDIQPHERGSVLKFAHYGWPTADDFYMHCNGKWGFFLCTSLKDYLETGTGKPHPADPLM